MADTSTGLRDLVREYQARRITRRAFMQRAIGLGLSLPAISSLLASTAAAAPAPSAQEARATGPSRVQTGGILREGYDLDFSRMDPINTTWYDPGFFALYEAAITNDPQGNYVPQLAQSWEFSPDGTKLTLHLRDGAKFHTGRPVDATAIKEVYDAIKDPNSGSPLGGLMGPIDSVDTPDAKTVVLNLKHPYYDILNVIKTGYWRIVNMQTRNQLGAEYGKKVIDGSGPFTFGEWVPGSHVTVNRWDDYPGSITPYFENKGKAYLDGIRWEAILEASQRAIRIENGELDTLHAPAFQDVERLQGNPDLNVITLKEWSGYFMGTSFERKDLDFHELKMRQAISMAFDRQAMVDALFFGQGTPLYGPVTSGDKYYTKDVENYNQFDLNRAKQLVAELGWMPGSDGILTKNGVRMEFSLVIQAESQNQQLGSVIQAQLHELGMNVNVQAFDRGTYFGKLFGTPAPDAFMFFYLWPVPIDVVILFVGTGNSPNWQKASIPSVDAAIQAWQQASNEDELRLAGATFQVEVARNLPIIPLVNRNNIWVNRKNVHGWLPHQWNLYPYYNDVWIEK